MKKTITTICALVALSLSAQADFKLNYACSAENTAPALSLENDGELIADSVTMALSKTGSGANGVTTDYLATGNRALTAYTVNTNIGNGGTWTMNFAFSLNQDVTLDSLAFTVVTTDSNGDAQPNNRTPKLTYTLTTADGSEVSTASLSQQITSSVSNYGTFTFDVAELLSAGDYKLSLKAEKTATGGFFLGLQTASFVTSSVAPAPVPEPATATLSLLALAGLAARRRRK